MITPSPVLVAEADAAADAARALAAEAAAEHAALEPHLAAAADGVGQAALERVDPDRVVDPDERPV